MSKKEIKTKSLDEITDKYIGKTGTQERDEFENALRLDLIGLAIKQARLRHILRPGYGYRRRLRGRNSPK